MHSFFGWFHEHWWVYETVGSSGHCQLKECHSPQFQSDMERSMKCHKLRFIWTNICRICSPQPNWTPLFIWMKIERNCSDEKQCIWQKNTIEILHPPDIFQKFNSKHPLNSYTPGPPKKMPGSRSPASPGIYPMELINWIPLRILDM